MKARTAGFLSKDHIDHDSEQFDYIRELHEYLWRFVRAVNPAAQGCISNHIDVAIESIELAREKGSVLDVIHAGRFKL